MAYRIRDGVTCNRRLFADEPSALPRRYRLQQGINVYEYSDFQLSIVAGGGIKKEIEQSYA